MERIESPDNRSVRRAIELRTPRGVEKHGAFLVEGPRFISDIFALEPELILETMISDAASPGVAPAGLPGRSMQVPEKVFRLISDTVHSQGIVAVCSIPQQPVGLLRGSGPASILVLDRISDPGNAGTLLRCAAAFGFDAVMALEGTCSLFTTKVTRASAGMNAIVPVYEGLSADSAMEMLEGAGFAAIAAEVDGMPVYDSAALPPRIALILGSEAHGIDRTVKARCASSISVPQRADVDSLNVAVAGAVLMSWLGYSRLSNRG